MTPTINFHPDIRILRQFGFIALGGFGVLATAALTESFVFSVGLGAARVPLTLGFSAMALLCLLFSLVQPKLNKPIYLTLSLATFPIGFVLSYVIMAALFFLVIGPIGLALRLFGKDPLERRPEQEAVSYWSAIERHRSPESYFRQF